MSLFLYKRYSYFILPIVINNYYMYYFTLIFLIYRIRIKYMRFHLPMRWQIYIAMIVFVYLVSLPNHWPTSYFIVIYIFNEHNITLLYSASSVFVRIVGVVEAIRCSIRLGIFTCSLFKIHTRFESNQYL